MKINEVSRRLDEGFLDNLVSAIQNLAGGDGPTGIVRALQGKNAALSKFADAIANAVTPKMMRRAGNSLAQIQDGTLPMPVGEIYKQTATVGSQIAARDNINVDPALIKQTIRSNKEDILKIVLYGDPGDDAKVRLIFDAVNGGTGTASIGVPFEQTIRTVALIVAGTIVFIETQQEDAETEFDEAAVEKFKSIGAEINKLLVLESSPVIQSLKLNEKLKDNIESLLVGLATTIKNKFLTLSPEQIAAAVTTTPELMQPALVTRLLSSHVAGLDPATVGSAVNAIMPLINAQFKEWLTIAATEQTPGRPKSFELYKAWLNEALGSLDNLEVGTTPIRSPTTPTPTAPEAIPPAGETPTTPAIASIVDAVKKLSPADRTKLTGQLLDVIGGGGANPASRV